MIFGSVVLLIFVVLMGLLLVINELIVFDWKILVFLCLGGVLFGNLFWVFVFGLIVFSCVVVFVMFLFVGVVVFGMFLLGEIFFIIVLCGLVLVLVGIYII